MTSIENRVVSIDFDNKDFEAKAAATLVTLDKLSKSLDFSNAKQGFDGISAAANGVNLGGLSAGIDSISSKFSAMGVVGFEVIRKLTDTVLHAGSTLGKMVFDPLAQGGKQRALNIQQAEFQFRGLGVNVTAAMDSAKAAVLGTAYGLDSAAKEAAQLSASGIKVGADMTQALRATAGAAAMTGSSFDEIAQIFTTVAGVGKVGNQQLNEFAYRGLNAAAAVGKQMGITEADVHQMATDGKLDFATFSKAMDGAFGAHATAANETYAGSLANMHAALSRIGAAFQTPLLEGKRDVFNALTPAIDKVKTAMKPLIDAFTVVTKLKFGNLAKGIDKINFGALTYAMPDITKGFLNLMHVIERVIGPIKNAFRAIFPKNAGSGIMGMAKNFSFLTKKLLPNVKTMNNLKRIFVAVFSVVKVVKRVFHDLFWTFAQLTGGVHKSSGGLLEFVAHLADVVSWCLHFVLAGNGLERFFHGLVDTIAHPMKTIDKLKSSLVSLFSGNTLNGGKKATGVFGKMHEALGRVAGAMEKSKSWLLQLPGANLVVSIVERLKQRFQELASIPGKVVNAFHHLISFFQPVINVFKEIGKVIGGFFHELGKNLASSLKAGDFHGVLDAINIGLLGGVILLLKKFFEGGVSLDFSKGFLGRASKALSGLSTHLKLMQTQIKAKALLDIAKAVAIMTISVIALSLVDSGKLTKALAAMAVGFGQLVGVFAILNKMGGTSKDAAKMQLVGGLMIELAIAVTIMSVALKKLSKIKAGDLLKGTVAITTLMAAMATSTRLLAKDPKGIVRAGLALIEISVAMNILAHAVKMFGKLSWGEIAKGMVGIGGGLIIIVAAMNLMPVGSALKALGLVEVALALNILAGAVYLFGKMNWTTMGKGLLGIAGALVIVGLAVNLLPITLPITAAGLILVGVALGIIAGAVDLMGKMKLGTLAKGLGSIAAVLLILAVGLTAMDGTLPGAAAVVVAAVSLKVLADVIKTLGELKISELVTGLIGIAAVLAVLGLAALLLTPVIPALLGLGAALLLIGGGFALFGLGVSLVADGLTALAKAGKSGVKAFIDIINALVAEIPGFIAAIVTGLIGAMKNIVSALPALTTAFGDLLDALAKTLVKVMPKLIKLFDILLNAIIAIITAYAPKLITLGIKLLEDLLAGISENIGEITKLAASILVNFINGLADNVGQISDAGANLIISFIAGIGNSIQKIIDAGVDLVVKFLSGITNDIQKILDAATLLINTIILGIGGMATQIAQAGTDAVVAFLDGMTKDVKRITDAATLLIDTIILQVGAMGTSIGNAGAQALVSFLNGIAKNIGQVCSAAHNVVSAFTHCLGEVFGQIFGSGGQALAHFIGGIIGGIGTLIGTGASVVAHFLLGIGSQVGQLAGSGLGMVLRIISGIGQGLSSMLSKGEEMAGNLISGLINGIKKGLGSVISTVSGLGSSMIKAGMSAIGAHSPSREFMKIGGYVTAGLSIGIDKGQGRPISSVTGLADKMKMALTESIGRLPSILDSIDNINPTITPVLDLSLVQSQAQKLGGIMGTPVISPDVSYGNARGIATAADGQNGSDSVPSTQSSVVINMEQHNHSPKALSTNDIYKNTHSQLAQFKKELDLV